MQKPIISTIMFIAVSACGVLPAETLYFHPVENKPVKDVVTLSENSGDGFTITKINNIKIKPLGMGRNTKGIRLNPGSYEITIWYGRDSYANTITAEASIKAHLEAGHTYVPRGKMTNNGKVIMILQDKGENYPDECLVNTPFIESPSYCE